MPAPYPSEWLRDLNFPEGVGACDFGLTFNCDSVIVTVTLSVSPFWFIVPHNRKNMTLESDGFKYGVCQVPPMELHLWNSVGLQGKNVYMQNICYVSIYLKKNLFRA